MSFIKYKWQLHIYRYTLWSSRLSQHHRMWTSHVVCTNSVAKIDIFTRSSSTLGEGGGRVTVSLFGQRICWFTVDIICQHLADSALTSRGSCTVSNWSSDDALAAPMTDSSRLERGVIPD